MQIPLEFPPRYQCLGSSIFASVFWTSVVSLSKWEVAHVMSLAQISWNRFWYSPVLASWIESVLLITVAELARQPLPQEKDLISLLVKTHRKTWEHFSENDVFCAGRVSKFIELKAVCSLESSLSLGLTMIFRDILYLVYYKNDCWFSEELKIPLFLGCSISQSSV